MQTYDPHQQAMYGLAPAVANPYAHANPYAAAAVPGAHTGMALYSMPQAPAVQPNPHALAQYYASNPAAAAAAVAALSSNAAAAAAHAAAQPVPGAPAGYEQPGGASPPGLESPWQQLMKKSFDGQIAGQAPGTATTAVPSPLEQLYHQPGQPSDALLASPDAYATAAAAGAAAGYHIQNSAAPGGNAYQMQQGKGMHAGELFFSVCHNN